MQLPPKRYSDYKDPKWDSIRHLSWFHTLAERREKLSLLECARKDIKFVNYQDEVADAWGIDKRELRDYVDFIEGRSRFSELPIKDQKAFQLLLDQSYDVYRDTGGARPLTKVIYEQSLLFGVNPRHVVELWETDPAFYPTQYRGIK